MCAPGIKVYEKDEIERNISNPESLQGLNKDKEKSDKGPDSRVSNSFWVYSIAANRWTCYYKNENSSPDYWNMMQHLEPRPRYAHQLAYDDVNRVSDSNQSIERLNRTMVKTV